jgi:hypothetical protein
MKSDGDICINSLSFHEEDGNIDIGGKPISFSVPIDAPNLIKLIISSQDSIKTLENKHNTEIKVVQNAIDDFAKEVNNLRTILATKTITSTNDSSIPSASETIIRQDIESCKMSINNLAKSLEDMKTSNELISSLGEAREKEEEDNIKKLQDSLKKLETSIELTSTLKNKEIESLTKRLEDVEKRETKTIVINADKSERNEKQVSSESLFPTHVSDGWVQMPFTLIPLSENTIGLRSGVNFTRGMKLMVEQSGLIKYFIIVDIDSSLITVFGGNKYVLDLSKVVKSYYSINSTPLNFDADPLDWTKTYTTKLNKVEVKKNEFKTIATIKVPIGAWGLSYNVYVKGKKEQTILSTLSLEETKETIPNSTDIEYGCKLIKLSAKENVRFNLEKKMFLIIKSDEDDVLDFSGYDIKLSIISNYL